MITIRVLIDAVVYWQYQNIKIHGVYDRKNHNNWCDDNICSDN